MSAKENLKTEAVACDMLSDDIVAQYLKQNPTFFLRRDDLLAEMQLPHASGNAISLVEKQVNILRERNMEMRHRLSGLLDHAKDNDQLFEKTQRLILSLLEAKGIDDLVQRTEQALLADFGVDFCQLTLIGEPLEHHTLKARMVPLTVAMEKAAAFIEGHKTSCGVLRSQEVDFLFAGQSGIGSAAIASINQKQPVAVLAIGSKDPNRYRSNIGTLFLDFVAEVLRIQLPDSLKRES